MLGNSSGVCLRKDLIRLILKPTLLIILYESSLFVNESKIHTMLIAIRLQYIIHYIAYLYC